MTTAPGRITSGVIMDGTPAAPTTMSAARVRSGPVRHPGVDDGDGGVGARLLERQQQRQGRPSVGPRPTMTTRRPATGIS